jgi:hypothetical protein
LNAEPTRVSATAELKDALLLSTSFVGQTAELQSACEGGAGRGGDCYGYVFGRDWPGRHNAGSGDESVDCAPLLPIMEEAGGTFTDWGGVRTAYGGNSIATNGALFEEVMSLIRQQ